MAFQLGTKKSLDGIVNYFIIFGLCLKISQTVTNPKLSKGGRKIKKVKHYIIPKTLNKMKRKELTE